MGDHNVSQEPAERESSAFMRALLNDLAALDRMIATGQIESGIRRIGAEQEMFLVDRNLRPAPVASEVLKRAGDPRLTTEIGKFNLEANLSPQPFNDGCLRAMEQEIEELIRLVREAANVCGAEVLLTGILPTIRQSDLSLDNLTVSPRYTELNRAMSRLRRGNFSAYIKGLDELQVFHDNIMLEACCTSFQVHLQVDPCEFAPLYNLAQLITAPVLAAAVNSPLLLGHRLWHETRVALFQHSVDERSSTHLARGHPTRVSFGERWLKESVLEIFREEIARFQVVIRTRLDEDPMAVLARGEPPRLLALRLHNGTVWRWNRPCYGVLDGRGHLRIEMRALPSGPTVADEMANAAFFLGLMSALDKEYGEVSRLMPFDDAKDNFFAAARYGLKSQFTWVDGTRHTASGLILDHLLPLARRGLKQSGIDGSDHYLDTIEDRVRRDQTGAQWSLRSLAAMETQGTADSRHRALARAMLAHQQAGEPVHSWPAARLEDDPEPVQGYQTVGQFMSTDLFTVRPDDLVDLVASVMDWRHIRHVPVEDDEGHLVGLISHRDLLRLMARGRSGLNDSLTVRSIMKLKPVTVTAETSTLEAIDVMRRNKVGCLPIVNGDRLVGIVTAYDFLALSAKLVEEHLKGSPRSSVCAELPDEGSR
jgi:CBS domain-containing protein/gamma-glutamyl:cysteine ligase YbdK (ATP-grasp superfamily)